MLFLTTIFSTIFFQSMLLIVALFLYSCRSLPDPPPPTTSESTPIVREITENYGTTTGLKYLHVEFTAIADTLLRRGIDTSFLIKMLNDTHLNFEESLVRINVSAPIKRSEYSSNYNKQSVKKCKDFITKNSIILDSVEQKYMVPKEAIVAILWVETKFGTVLGKNYVPSTFFSVALAGSPENIEKNIEFMRSTRSPTDTGDIRAMERKIEERAKKKSNWALGELMALDTLRKISPISVFELFGSSAGAFGISQFLPSSYIRWSSDGNADGKVNLFELPDAIYSVANYLKVND